MIKRPKTRKDSKRDCFSTNFVKILVIGFLAFWFIFFFAAAYQVINIPFDPKPFIPRTSRNVPSAAELVDQDVLESIKHNKDVTQNEPPPMPPVNPKEAAVLAKLKYWKKDKPVLEPTDRFLFFDTDCGGFNNIRIAFELYIVVAWLTNRTLVLPPRRGWYLLDFGPQTRMKVQDQSGTSEYSDYFDITDMRRGVPVMTMKDFMDKHGKEFELDPHFADEVGGRTGNRNWINWKNKHWSDVSPAWDPYEHSIFWPTIDSVKDIDRKRLDNRKKIEISKELMDSKVMNFASCKGKGYRYLGQIANWVQYADRGKQLEQFRLVRDSMHYVERVFEIAAKVIAFLGLFEYSSFHIRRNELQYKENFIPAAKSFENTNVLLNDNEKLYIATDETSPTFFDFIEKKHPVYRWQDFFEERGGYVLKDVDIPRKLIGCIEQVICAGGRHFFGTKASTFSAYIFRLRGFIQSPDNDHLFLHVRKYTGDADHDAQRPYGYSAREYMMEFPELWQSIQD